MGTRSFPGVKSDRGVTLTPYQLLVPWSRKGRDIPLLPLWAVRPIQSLSVCTRMHFTLLFLSRLCLRLPFISKMTSVRSSYIFHAWSSRIWPHLDWFCRPYCALWRPLNWSLSPWCFITLRRLTSSPPLLWRWETMSPSHTTLISQQAEDLLSNTQFLISPWPRLPSRSTCYPHLL